MEPGHAGLRQRLQKHFFSTFSHLSSNMANKTDSNSNSNSNSNNMSQAASQATSSSTMSISEPPRTESMTTSNAAWVAPTSQPRQLAVPTQESFAYYHGDENGALSPWAPAMSSPIHQTQSEAMERAVSSHQDLYPATMISNGQWNQKSCEDNYDFHVLDPEASIGQAYTTDDAVSIIDLRYSNAHEGDHLAYDGSINRRRMSGSSPTMSTSGGLSEMASCDDFSAALSEAPSFSSSDYPPTSNRTSLMSSTQLSPVPSPRLTPQSRPEQVRAQSRGRASPSPRPSKRSAPYSIEASRPNKRWSTGSYGNSQMARNSPALYSSGHDMSGMGDRRPLQSLPPPPPSMLHSSLPMNFGNSFLTPRPPFMMSGHSMYQRNNMLLPPHAPSPIPSQVPSQAFHHETHHFSQPPPLPSHGLLRILQSNGDPHCLSGHYTDLSDPPDLFASLREDQIPPPPEDMNPSNPDLIPYEQEVRFEGDLYTPRWVRGHGNKREGWCGICKPGRWLVLKNSAYWYDKSFTHGISATTGSPFQEPLDSRRMDGNPDVWEGLCGGCNEWIALVSSKKKGTTWFRHAYKCHTHPKIKDAPKRRRENISNRTSGVQIQSPVKAKLDKKRPVTPQMSSPATAGLGTPASAAGSSTPTMGSMPLQASTSQPRQLQQDSQQQIHQELPQLHYQQYQHQGYEQHLLQQQQQHQHQRAPLIPPPLRLCSIKTQATSLLSPVESYGRMI